MVKVYPRLRKDRYNEYAEHEIVIVVYYNKKRAFVRTDYHCKVQDWNGTAREVRRNHPRSVVINRNVSAMVEQLRDAAHRLKKAGQLFSARNVVDSYSAESVSQNLFDYFASDLTHRKYYDAKQGKTTLNMLREFVGRSIDIHEFTERDARDLLHWMIHTKGFAPSTIHRRFKRIKGLFKSAVQDGVILANQNPFNQKFELPKDRSTQRDLKMTKTDWEKFKAVEPFGKAEQLAKDIFIIQVLLFGARIGDVLQLKWSDIENDMLRYTSMKTADKFEFKLSEREYSILNRYEKNDPYIFPFLIRKSRKRDLSQPRLLRKAIESSTTVINRTLKILADRAELSPPLDKKLSTHVARHTFAYLASDSMPLHYLQEALGHESIDQTRQYIGKLKGTNLESYRDDFLSGM
jgi:integrase